MFGKSERISERKNKTGIQKTKKKILVIGAGITILIAGIGLGLALGRNRSLPSVAPITTNLTNSSAKSEVKDNVLVKVIRVIDGDTIEIEGGERVRYIGIDTPETVDPRKPVQCFGVESSNKNKELVEGKMARLEKDITDRDKYHRLLRYVYVGDTFINLELVKQGFAYSYSYPPDIKYQEKFLKAQQEAREIKRGLWAVCLNDSRVSDFSVSSSRPVSSSQTPNDYCLIKGNISTSGEKIYHLPECAFYSKTQISTGRGEKWFCTEAEAQAAGWRKALNCP